MNPFRPRASSANLLVRRVAFEEVGGYTEGIWAGEDTDFTWRLQDAGWTLEFNEHAVVQHAYRETLRELGRQWRGYAAGARWLSERYPDFRPDPGLNRGVRLLLERVGIGPGVAFRADGRSTAVLGAADAPRALRSSCSSRSTSRSRSRSGCACPTRSSRAPGPSRWSVMRVDLVDPPAYSPPYDHALAAALARHGASVRLVTSRFAYGEPPAPDGYARDEYFYRHAFGPAGSRARALSKRAEHLPDMLRYRRAAARDADVVHFQWLTVPRLDLRLLPERPTVLTIHDPLERGRAPLRASRVRGVDAIVVHSDYAREQVIAQHHLEAERVHVIRHGALVPILGDFCRLGRQNSPSVPSELPAELHDTASRWSSATA